MGKSEELENEDQGKRCLLCADKSNHSGCCNVKKVVNKPFARLKMAND